MPIQLHLQHFNFIFHWFFFGTHCAFIFFIWKYIFDFHYFLIAKGVCKSTAISLKMSNCHYYLLQILNWNSVLATFRLYFSPDCRKRRARRKAGKWTTRISKPFASKNKRKFNIILRQFRFYFDYVCYYIKQKVSLYY